MRSLSCSAALLAVCLLACNGISTIGGATAPQAPQPPAPTGSAAFRILFIGNSLTATNDLPAMVQTLLVAAGRTDAHVESVTFGGFALQDHWSQGDALARINSHRWEWVILQQGPSALDSSRANLRQWTVQFAPPIRASGAQVGLYMVWPAHANFSDFSRVHDSYKLAAQDVSGVFLPAGQAWLRAWELDPALALYGPDDFHPSVTGSYVAALVIAEKLCACEIASSVVPASLRTQVGEASLPVLHQAAKDTIAAE